MLQEANHTASVKNPGVIHGDWLIADLVTQHPEVVETLMAYGIHCIGCSVSTDEKLEDGVKGHGMSDDEFHGMLRDLNEVVKEKELRALSVPFTISKQASEKLLQLLLKQRKEGWGVRLKAEKEGNSCCSIKYGMNFEEKEKEGDSKFELLGLSFFLDPESLKLYKGVNVSFVETPQGAGFHIFNPTEHSDCSCKKDA